MFFDDVFSGAGGVPAVYTSRESTPAPWAALKVMISVPVSALV